MTHPTLYRAGFGALLALLISTATPAQAQGYDPDAWANAPRVRLVTDEGVVEAWLAEGDAEFTNSAGSLRAQKVLNAEDLMWLRADYQQASFFVEKAPTSLEVWEPGADAPVYLDADTFSTRDLVLKLSQLAADLHQPLGRAKRVALATIDTTPGGVRAIEFDGRRVRVTYELNGHTYQIPTPKLGLSERWNLRRRVRRLRIGTSQGLPAFLPHMSFPRGVELRVGDGERTLHYTASRLTDLPRGTELLVGNLSRLMIRSYHPVELTITGRVFQGRIISHGLTVLTTPAIANQVGQWEGREVVLHALVQDNDWAIALYVQELVAGTAWGDTHPAVEEQVPSGGVVDGLRD